MRALLLRLLLAPRKRGKGRPHARPFILHSSLLLVPAPHASICVCAYNMRKTNYTYIHVGPIFVYTHTHTHSHSQTHTHAHAHARAHTCTCKHAEHSALKRRVPTTTPARGQLITAHAHDRAHGRAGSGGGDAGAVAETHHRRGQNRRKCRRRFLLACHSPPALPSTAINVSVPTNARRKSAASENLLPRRLAVRVCPSCSTCLCLCGDWHRCSLYIGERASRARVPRLR
jgi:hypothetical protein